MRIAIDTNVLVRFLLRDDEVQAAAAKSLIDGAESVVIPIMVLCELVWVLKRACRLSTREIADQISELVGSRRVELDRPAAEAGLKALASGGDFADGVIQHEAGRYKCDRIATFDRDFARIPGPPSVLLLGVSPNPR